MQPDIRLTLIILTFLEIILGVDNIIFLSLMVARLPLSQQSMMRRLGLSCAMIVRTLLLISITRLSHITQPLLIVSTLEVPSRTLILLGGGLFLIYKVIQGIREELSLAQENGHGNGSRQLPLCGATVQIMLLNIVSSLDSVITAIDLSQHIFIMIAVVMIIVGIMMFAARIVGDFVNAIPSIKILALTFLLFVGVLLIVDSFDVHTVEGYLYFAIFFSLSTKTLNITRERKDKKVSTLIKTRESRSY